MRTGFLILATVLLAALPPARGQDPLLPEDVARAAAAHYPEIVEALAGREAAAGELLAARGAFDTVFAVEGRSRLAGYYDGQVAEAKIERPFGGPGDPYGGKAYGAYRLSDGIFPIYEDAAFTNEAGEFKLGVLFSLLRDRRVDARRVGIRNAELAVEAAELDLLLARVGVQRRALLAYYAWVEAGRELEVYRDLLALAETRQSALEREVARGARAAIFLTENAQNLTRRRALVERTRRDLALRANALSLYYRGADGSPVVPGPEALPPGLPPPPPLIEADLPAVLAQRPDLALLRNAAERARNDILLAENRMRPRLDLSLEAGQDIGPIAEGGFTRDEGEVILGLRFEVPLGRRAARGERAAARAALRGLEAEQRLLSDRVAAELRDVVIALDAAERLVSLAARGAEQAEAMRAAEQRRFRAGASDFFLVNLREQAVADARVGYALALLDLRAARATYDAAVLDLGRLGLR